MPKNNWSGALSAIAMILLLPAHAPADAVECYEQDNLLILANDHVRMAFSPSQGGRCVSLRMAPFGMEKELVAEAGEAAAADGLFADGFWGLPTSLHNRAYAHTISGEQRSRNIHFVIRVGGDLPFLELHKTVSLDADSARIRVTYDFHNRRESYTDYSVGFQVTNRIMLEQRPPVAVVPTTDGPVRHAAADAGRKEFADPAGDWMALLWGRRGLLLRTDFPYLDSLAHPGASVMMRKLTVGCGETVSLTLSLEPVVEFDPDQLEWRRDGASLEDKIGKSRRAAVEEAGQFNVSMEYETPHVRWARPYSRGRIKALVLTNAFQQREIVELAQRVGLDVDTVSFSMAGYRYFGDSTLRNHAEAQARLLRYLSENDYDVMVIGALEYQHTFDKACRDQIVSKIKAGMGLVYATPSDLDETMSRIIPLGGDVDVNQDSTPGVWEKVTDHFIVNGFDFGIFPVSGFQPYVARKGEIVAQSNDGRPLIVVSQAEKGRVVTLGYDGRMQYPDRAHFGAGLTPQLATSDSQYERPQFQPERELQYDYWEYYFSLLSKCVVWAAQKENGFDLPKFVWTEQGAQLELTVDNAGDTESAKAAFVFRDKYSDVLGRKEIDLELRHGQTTMTVPVELAPMHGNNYCELVVSDKLGRSLTWGVAYSKGEKPKHIDRLELTATTYRVGSPIVGEVFFNGPGTAKRFDLTFELHDLNGRLVDRRAVNYTYAYPGMCMQGFILSTDRCIDDGGLLIVRLAVDGVPWDVMRKRIAIITEIDPDEFYLSGWAGRFDGYYLKELRMKRLREIGFKVANVTALESTYGIPQSVAFWRQRGWKVQTNYTIRPGTRNTGYNERYAKTRDKTELVRTPCFANPDFINRSTNDFVTAATQLAPYGHALNYGAGDEIRLNESLCFCPYCMANYRARLRIEYESLDDLNAEWGTDYKSFSVIFPDTLAEAHDRGNYASWVLWRQSMEASLLDFFRKMTAGIRTIDPEGRVHVSGTIGDLVHYGMDYWHAAKLIDFKGYNEWWLVGELLRSFGTTRNQPYAYSWGHIWLDVLQGAHGGVGSWCMAQLALRPDLSLTDSSGAGKKRFVDDMVRPGLTRLLKHSVRDNSRIGLHYSRLSRFAARAMDPERGEHPTWEYNLECWAVALNTLGFQFDMLSFHELEAGNLSPSHYDIFILPTSYALKSSEVEAIKAYVRGGGTVITDGRAGQFNEHLIRNDPHPLDDLFGVKSSADPKAAEATLAPWGAKVEILDTGLEIAGAKRLFDTKEPVALVHAYGKGKAIYLNARPRVYLKPNWEKLRDLSILHYITHFVNLEGQEKADEDRILTAQHALLSDVLEAAGKQAPIIAAMADGGFLISKLVHYHSGDASLLGFLAGSSGGEVEIKLDRKYHVHDVLARRDLGHTDTIRPILKPGQDLPGGIYFVTHARLYALLPEKPQRLVVQGPQDVGLGDKVSFSVSLAGPLSGRTTVYITVEDPDGRRLSHYEKSMFLRYGGTAVPGALRLALNDKHGRWKIRARDMLSGAHAQHSFVVKP